MNIVFNGRTYSHQGGGEMTQDKLNAMDNLVTRCLAHGDLELMGHKRKRISPRLELFVHANVNLKTVTLVGQFYGKNHKQIPGQLIYTHARRV